MPFIPHYRLSTNSIGIDFYLQYHLIIMVITSNHDDIIYRLQYNDSTDYTTKTLTCKGKNSNFLVYRRRDRLSTT